MFIFSLCFKWLGLFYGYLRIYENFGVEWLGRFFWGRWVGVVGFWRV